MFGDRWDEVQEIRTQADPSSSLGGTFRLTFAGNTTGAIEYNAPAETIKASLEALWSIASVEVSDQAHDVQAGIGQLKGKIWTVTFTGMLRSAEGGFNGFLVRS